MTDEEKLAKLDRGEYLFGVMPPPTVVNKLELVRWVDAHGKWIDVKE